MHVMGNVFLWLCVVLILAATTLSTMVLDVRSKWLREVEQRQQQLVESREQLRDAELKVRNLDEELQRRIHLWGDVWVANNSGPQPGGRGIVELGVGSGSGLGVKAQTQGRPNPSIFVFAQTPQGESQYLGEFRLQDVLVDRASARLARNPYPQEAQGWPAGEYRVRENLPGGWRSAFAELESQQLIAESKLRTQGLELEILTSQIQASQAALDQRLAELNGNPNAPAGADQEFLDGLVETVRKFEAERNQLLSEVNRLRRQLDRDYVRLRQTLAANEAAVERLREAAADSSSLGEPRLTVEPVQQSAVTAQEFRLP